VDERERIARLICGAMNAGNEDVVVSYGEPLQILPRAYIVPPKEFRAPLWALYTAAADVIIADAERQAEQARARYAAAAIADDD
jgi:hypothetical protein